MAWTFDDYRLMFGNVVRFGQSLPELIGNVRDKRIIEIGCGQGAFCNRLAEEGAVVIGFDHSHAFIAEARRTYPDIEFKQTGGYDFEVDSPADFIISRNALHLVPADQQPIMFASAYAALKEGGHIIIEMGGRGDGDAVLKAVAATCQAHNLPFNHHFFFPSISDYALLAENAGFTVEYAAHYACMTSLNGPDALEKWIELLLQYDLDNFTAEERRTVIGRPLRNSGRSCSSITAGTSTTSS